MLELTEGPGYRAAHHHTFRADYVRVHSNNIREGTVSVGLSTITDKNDYKVETTTLYLSLDKAQELLEILTERLNEGA